MILYTYYTYNNNETLMKKKKIKDTYNDLWKVNFPLAYNLNHMNHMEFHSDTNYLFFSLFKLLCNF